MSVNRSEVVRRDFPIAVGDGAVGLSVIDHATMLFEDLVITPL